MRHRTFLLNWNPRRGWSIDEKLAEFKKNGCCEVRWSSGVRKDIEKGDRIFLIKQGSAPKGIFGSGTATSAVRLNQNNWANRIPTRIDCLRDPSREEFLDRALLSKGLFRTMHWDIQGGGVLIPPKIAEALEEAWAKITGRSLRKVQEREIRALEGTLTEFKGYSRKRDKVLRDTAIANSKGICEACAVNFSCILEGLGRRALQVHHKKQMSSYHKPQFNSPEDLAVLCANCHSMIHHDAKRPMKVEELRRKLRGYRGP